MVEEGSSHSYPSTQEIQKAIEEEPEFLNKSAAVIRAKLQYEFKVINERLKEELEMEMSSEESEEN